MVQDSCLAGRRRRGTSVHERKSLVATSLRCGTSAHGRESIAVIMSTDRPEDEAPSTGPTEQLKRMVEELVLKALEGARAQVMPEQATGG